MPLNLYSYFGCGLEAYLGLPLVRMHQKDVPAPVFRFSGLERRRNPCHAGGYGVRPERAPADQATNPWVGFPGQ
jgi:hypothetical protein